MCHFHFNPTLVQLELFERRKYKEPFPCFNPTLVQLESAATRRNLTQIYHFFRTFPNQHFPRA